MGTEQQTSGNSQVPSCSQNMSAKGLYHQMRKGHTDNARWDLADLPEFPHSSRHVWMCRAMSWFIKSFPCKCRLKLTGFSPNLADVPVIPPSAMCVFSPLWCCHFGQPITTVLGQSRRTSCISLLRFSKQMIIPEAQELNSAACSCIQTVLPRWGRGGRDTAVIK